MAITAKPATHTGGSVKCKLLNNLRVKYAATPDVHIDVFTIKSWPGWRHEQDTNKKNAAGTVRQIPLGNMASQMCATSTMQVLEITIFRMKPVPARRDRDAQRKSPQEE